MLLLEFKCAVLYHICYKSSLMKTDIEIAQSVELQPIVDVVKKIGIDYVRLGAVRKVQGQAQF